MIEPDRQADILRRGPVGTWRTSAGSADALGADDVRFAADGTGLITSRSVLFGDEKVSFLWAMEGTGQVKLRFPAEPGEIDEPDDWWVATIEFRLQRNDLGEVDVMAEAGKDGFWWLVHPLRWIGTD